MGFLFPSYFKRKKEIISTREINSLLLIYIFIHHCNRNNFETIIYKKNFHLVLETRNFLASSASILTTDT